jgi:hypothetical protein
VRPRAATPALRSELELIAEAEREARSNPKLALRLAGEHQKRFPNGMLSEEREVLAIEALARLGQTAGAEARAQAFLQRYPTSGHRRRVELAARGSQSSKKSTEPQKKSAEPAQGE